MLMLYAYSYMGKRYALEGFFNSNVQCPCSWKYGKIKYIYRITLCVRTIHCLQEKNPKADFVRTSGWYFGAYVEYKIQFCFAFCTFFIWRFNWLLVSQLSILMYNSYCYFSKQYWSKFWWQKTIVYWNGTMSLPLLLFPILHDNFTACQKVFFFFY